MLQLGRSIGRLTTGESLRWLSLLGDLPSHGGAGVNWKNEIGPLPRRVEVVECGPRDGLQNERQLLPTLVKAELIARLVQTGAPVVEVTSFVKPTAVPQMADAVELFSHVMRHNTAAPFPALNNTLGGETIEAQIARQRRESVRFACLVPNLKGLHAALEQGCKEISIFAAASSTFSRNNINCTTEESYERYAPVVALAKERQLRVRVYVSTVLGCPFEGEVKPGRVADVVAKFWKMGCDEVALGDTIGTGTPGSTRNLLLALRDVLPVDNLAVHFHDTWGQALPNILTSLLHGVSIVDSSVAGLGGCPYAPAATGNVATEDVLFMLHGLGIETGIDLDKMIQVGDWISSYLGKHSRSRVALAKSRYHTDR